MPPRVDALLRLLQVERSDQQTTNTASLALVAAGLAYTGVVLAKIIDRCGSSQCHGLPTAVLIATPLPIFAFVTFLLLGGANAVQRAKYMVELEAELEARFHHLSADEIDSIPRIAPRGFRRSERIFNPTYSPRRRDRITSALSGALTYFPMIVVEIGFTVYVLALVPDRGAVVAGAISYALMAAIQLGAARAFIFSPEDVAWLEDTQPA